jgi:hypothetical protein
MLGLECIETLFSVSMRKTAGEIDEAREDDAGEIWAQEQ